MATLDVVSFNVFVGVRSRGAPARERAVEFCRRLTDLDVDVVLLQEVWSRSLLRFIGARLPSLPHAAWRSGPAGQPAGGLAVFARRPLCAPTFTAFTTARPRSGNPLFRGTSALSCLLQGVLAVRTADGTLLLGNTQLTANRDGDWSSANRHHQLHHQQLRIVHRALRTAGAHAAPTSILGGDFNVASTSPLYPLIVDHGAWHDPFAPTDHPTCRAEYLPAGRPAHRIDYLLVSGHPVTSADLVLTEPAHLDGGNGFLSDHLAPRIRLGGTSRQA
ncbi:endonuclease/exonuclease/phosphatase family protein [Saccharothrix deserti]|uniref:endonuclease/exonuclease/phosphatase family protein n=1 Tax=Saccharothrix deserti TaxID=2593674 RepID=UPI00131D1854|nr:endonuclease/exonuclease/phosphatase family protein [Saccharothrix deserti]